MVGKYSATTAALLSLCMIVNVPALAQQTPGAPDVPQNRIVEQLLRASPEGEQIVELSGYVGPSTPETVRLYQDLSLAKYFEIPRNAIVHSVQERDPNTSPIKLYVRGSATIVSASRLTASVVGSARSVKAAALARFAPPAGRFGLRMEEPGQGSYCAMLLLLCAYSHEWACYAYVTECHITHAQ